MIPFVRILFVLSLAFMATACDKQVENYVKKALPDAQTDDEIQSSSPIGLKISPGRLEATSADVSMEANITPTRQIMTSPDVSASIGIGRIRVTQ